ncbi:MAG: DUF4863 family protein [Planctomycetes bacterium]|nr:DUF4863 family protein [Planctomycetota bacterium]
MTVTTKEQFVSLLAPVAAELRAVDVDAADAAAQAERAAAFTGAAITALRAAAVANIDSDWLLPKAANGIRFGRVAKDLSGFVVDAVLMDVPGPRHRHPNGEIDLCFATAGEPRFDDHPEGWVVYGKDTTHVPTVSGGTMLILYFLPGGAIEFLG